MKESKKTPIAKMTRAQLRTALRRVTRERNLSRDYARRVVDDRARMHSAIHEKDAAIAALKLGVLPENVGDATERVWGELVKAKRDGDLSPKLQTALAKHWESLR
jgi:hypothetical protein